MTNRQIPFLSIGLIILMAALYWGAADTTLLYFSKDKIAAGEVWRLISGHLIHADFQHLFWNCLGLGVVGALLEQHSRRRWVIGLLGGMTAVSALLLSPLSQLDFYCGLSGVLNTMLVILIWLEWKLTRSWIMIAIACGSIAKAVIEVYTGDSLITNISWPPYAWSHIAGLAGGAIIICIAAITARVNVARPHRRPVTAQFLPTQCRVHAK